MNCWQSIHDLQIPMNRLLLDRARPILGIARASWYQAYSVKQFDVNEVFCDFFLTTIGVLETVGIFVRLVYMC